MHHRAATSAKFGWLECRLFLIRGIVRGRAQTNDLSGAAILPLNLKTASVHRDQATHKGLDSVRFQIEPKLIGHRKFEDEK